MARPQSPLRRARHAIGDALRRVARRVRPPRPGSEPPVPPKRLVTTIGGSDFRLVGEEFVSQFVSLGGLKPTDRVLDVGCGCGRMAVPLTRVLSSGSYEGFDIDARAIAWCRDEITPRFRAFRFQAVSLRNTAYRPGGEGDAASFRFPYADGEFDFVFLTSVFTHLLRASQENYVAECARVTRRGGTLFASFFLLTDENRERVVGGNTAVRFPVESEGGTRLLSAEFPEAAIAFPEAEVVGRTERLGFRLARPIDHGTWSGAGGSSFQDLLIARRG
jgi:SAM-dependent methyltransferase